MRHWLMIVFLSVLLMQESLTAVTFDELKNDKTLTPKRFAKYFTEFEFRPFVEVRPPDDFLMSKVGDCDDYAILASLVLRPRGYEARLICVEMPGRATHAICYITEEKGYLDYNNREYFFKIEHCGPSLREIATKIAKSFSANWTSVSEFTTLKGGAKAYFNTVLKTDPLSDSKAPKKN